MAIALLLAAALAWWLHKRGELTPNLVRLAGAGVAGVIALRLLTSGKPLLAIIAAGIAWAAWVTLKPRGALPSDERSALQILGLAPGADADAINAAWRQRIAQVHPDAGGSDAAASSVTAARDLLLARQRKSR